MSETGYRVHLPVFEGPLDLLLQLIEREKLDISAVSLAQVADQFLSYVKELEEIRPDILTDFLMISARLILIKSRILLPRSEYDAEEDEDPAEALARQLREYKRFKEAAQALQEIEARGQHSYVRVAPPPALERRLDISDITLAGLLSAATTALFHMPDLHPMLSSVGMVQPFTLTIDDQIQRIKQYTAGGRSITFGELLREARHRLEVIVTLLAVLELVKRRQIDATQDSLFGEIFLHPMGTDVPRDHAREATWDASPGGCCNRS